MRIACLQTRGTPGDVEANLAELDAAAADAVSQGAGLLVAPEMFVTGYEIGDRVGELAELPLADRVAAIAAAHGLAVVAGLPEIVDGSCYNTAVLADRDGVVRARYRKTHLFGPDERKAFVPGDELTCLVDLDGVRLALLICYDVEFPEAVRAAALAGAHVVVVPTAQMEPFALVAERVVWSRAWENQVYVAYVNHDGTEDALTYVGRSSIIDPYGTVLASVELGTALLVADIDPAIVAAAQQDNPYLADRRTDLY
jgi:predicted amidohydrolase